MELVEWIEVHFLPGNICIEEIPKFPIGLITIRGQLKGPPLSDHGTTCLPLA